MKTIQLTDDEMETVNFALSSYTDTGHQSDRYQSDSLKALYDKMSGPMELRGILAAKCNPEQFERFKKKFCSWHKESSMYSIDLLREAYYFSEREDEG